MVRAATSEPDHQGERAIVHLHYFTGGWDFYLIEKDDNPEQHQAFGLVVGFEGELGYICLPEILQAESIFMPPYSLDFNPIEPMWSTVKEYLRKAKAQTAEALLAAIRDALQTVTATDAHGWLIVGGYATAKVKVL